MKTAVALALGLSLAANAVLVVAHVMRSAPLSEGRAEPSTGTSMPTVESMSDATLGRQIASINPEAGLDPTYWTSLPIEELPRLIARLRDAGISEKMVRAIAVSLVDERYDERFNFATTSRDPATMRERSQAQQELNNQFKAVLGDERHAEFERHADRGYQAAASVVEHFKLPPGNATAVYELAQDVAERGRALRSNRDLAPEQRDAQLRELAGDASSRLNILLTPEGAQAFRESGAAASWISLLETPPAPRITSGP